jgi:hypothetical protein
LETSLVVFLATILESGNANIIDASNQLESVLGRFTTRQQLLDSFRYEGQLLKSIALAGTNGFQSPVLPDSLIALREAEENGISGDPWAFISPNAGTSVATIGDIPGLLAGNISAGPWEPPGNQPIPLYIGTKVHDNIAQYYLSHHDRDSVYTNYITIAKIFEREKLDFGNLTPSGGGLKPDIANMTKFHLYEIKTVAEQQKGLKEVKDYQKHFRNGGVSMDLGSTTEPGSYGIVQAPGGHAIFAADIAGVITYRKKNGDYNEESAKDATGLKGLALLLFLIYSMSSSGQGSRPATQPGF